MAKIRLRAISRAKSFLMFMIVYRILSVIFVFVNLILS